VRRAPHLTGTKIPRPLSTSAELGINRRFIFPMAGSGAGTLTGFSALQASSQSTTRHTRAAGIKWARLRQGSARDFFLADG